MSTRAFWRLRYLMGVAAMAAAPVAFASGALAEGSAPLRLSAEQVVEAARLSLQNGNTQQAITLADALLLRDPADVTAHLIRAHALRSQGDFAAAQAAARSGWTHAATDTAKFNAALLMAQALASDGKRTRAQLWLRRARQVAPSPGHARRAARDFKYVQQRNPWQTYLSFTFAPNSNINNGASRDSYLSNSVLDRLVGGGPQLRPINPEAQALAGLEFGARMQTRYRFAQSARRAHDLRLGLSYRSYVLSPGSKADVPDAKGHDYAYGTASIGYGFRHLRRDGRGELSVNLDLGQTFYGGARYARYAQAHAAQSYYLDRRTKLRFGLVMETETGQRVSDSDSLSLSLGMDRMLASGDGFYLGVTVTNQHSPNALHEYAEAALRGGYVLGREVMGAQVQVGLGARLRDYDVHLLNIDGRRDLEVSFDVTATFRQIDYYGFNPQLSLRAARTNSNIGVYDTNRLGLSIGIASAF